MLRAGDWWLELAWLVACLPVCLDGWLVAGDWWLGAGLAGGLELEIGGWGLAWLVAWGWLGGNSLAIGN